jgi:hypothetical protein
MTQKALLQSAGDGTVTPAGYVGEIFRLDSPVLIPSASNQTWTMTTIPSKGVWSFDVFYGFSWTTTPTSVGAYGCGSSGGTLFNNAITAQQLTGACLPQKPSVAGAVYILQGKSIYVSDGVTAPTLVYFSGYNGSTPTLEIVIIGIRIA